MIFVRDIQQAVARRYRVPVSIMTQPDGLGTRAREFTRPRQVAMTLAVDITRHGPTRIGQLFGGRDHSTVHHARNAVNGNDELRLSLIRLKMELGR